MAAANPPPQAGADEAQLLLRQGRIEEAERIYAGILERSPFDLQALNMVALVAIRAGQLHRAVELLQRALSVDARHASSHHHLGRAFELLGDLPGAARHYAEAARLSSDLPAARLHLASVLERQGQDAAALLQYTRVMAQMQSQGLWVDQATTPPALQNLVRRAAFVVREGRHDMLFSLLEPLVRDYGRKAMQRVEKMLRIHLGEEEARYPDPRQRPTFLYFPDLPTRPYLPREDLPWLEEYEARKPAILEELLNLLPEARGSERVFGSDALEEQNLRGSRGAPSWTGHYFYRHGEVRSDNLAACPATTAALDALPLNRVRDHGPEVMFSVFTQGTRLMPHRGVTNTRSVSHLPLIVPPDCALLVGEEKHVWQEGRVVTFDDTYEHSAWNDSADVRVVLIADIWNPYLTEAERLATARIVETLGDFRKAMDAA